MSTTLSHRRALNAKRMRVEELSQRIKAAQAIGAVAQAAALSAELRVVVATPTK